ncbi:fft2 [Symbiodinium sp. CCMP2592]|nr:fft2 [Symbiodinium sp. CCMP2592]
MARRTIRGVDDLAVKIAFQDLASQNDLEIQGAICQKIQDAVDISDVFNKADVQLCLLSLELKISAVASYRSGSIWGIIDGLHFEVESAAGCFIWADGLAEIGQSLHPDLDAQVAIHSGKASPKTLVYAVPGAWTSGLQWRPAVVWWFEVRAEYPAV